MSSLRLICQVREVNRLSAELWECGTSGIREIESAGQIVLITGIEKPIETERAHLWCHLGIESKLRQGKS